MKNIIIKYRIFLLIVFLSLITPHMFAQEFQKKLFISGTDTLPYNLLMPYDYDPFDNEDIAVRRIYPLILFLHGAGERGNDNEVQINHIKKLFLDSVNRKKYPAFVVAPQCPAGRRWVETSWEVSKHTMPTEASISVIHTMILIDSLLKELPISVNEIYVTGLSMGGFGTWDLICRYPDKFAAAIPICGGGDTTMAKKIKNKPIWAFHGSDDKVVKVILTRDMINSINKAGGTPKFTEYKGVGHNSWVNAYKEPDILEWLFKQNLLFQKEKEY